MSLCICLIKFMPIHNITITLEGFGGYIVLLMKK